jgi:hypothetical protein
MLHGRCHCGAIEFEAPEAAAFRAICHCGDCRRQSGAPFLAWAMFPRDAVKVRGEPRVYASSATGRRSFCGACGAGLFFSNAALDEMCMMQVRIAALDDPEAAPPLAQVQTAERIGWIGRVHELPAFARFPTAG